MTYFDVATAPLVYILVAIGIAMVVGVALISGRKAFQKCLDVGMSEAETKGVVKASSVFALVPSFSIVIGLISLSALIGLPWAWWRLSVVGAVTYETMVAQMAADAMGYTSFADAPAAVFGNVMFCMTIGIIFGCVMLVFVGKKLMTSYGKMRSSNGNWGLVMNSCFMIAMFAVMVPGSLTKGTVYCLTFVTSAVCSFLIAKIAQVTGAKWLNQFNLAICLILGMASSLLWTNLVG